MIDGEILGDLDRRVGHVSDTHHCGLRLSIDEISKVIEVVSNGRIASIVDHHKKLKCGVVVTGRDELLHFQHVLALLHLNVFGPEHGNLVGIIESLVGDHQVDLDRAWGSFPLRMYNPHPQCHCSPCRQLRTPAPAGALPFPESADDRPPEEFSLSLVGPPDDCAPTLESCWSWSALLASRAKTGRLCTNTPSPDISLSERRLPAYCKQCQLVENLKSGTD